MITKKYRKEGLPYLITRDYLGPFEPEESCRDLFLLCRANDSRL